MPTETAAIACWLASAEMSLCGAVSDPFQALEVGVLGPEVGVMGMSCSQHDAVGKRQLGLDTELSGFEREAIVEFNEDTTPHCRDDVQGFLSADVPKHMAIDLEKAEGRNKERFVTLDRSAEEGCVATTGQVFDPATRIDNVHNRSGSRSRGGSVG